MYDLIILGAGPAGLAASIYASRYKINHAVVGNVFDGSVPKAHMIENWPGERSITGSELIMKFYNHAKELGNEFISEEAVEINKSPKKTDTGRDIFFVRTSSNKILESKSLIIALGTKHKKLNIPGEEKLLGKGVSYCAVCDGAFFKGKTVAVVGGSNAAAMSATMLSEHAKKVFLIYRGKPLRCEPIVEERLEENPSVEIIYNTNVIKVEGSTKVESIEIDSVHEGSNIIKLDGVFIEIGAVPSTSLLKELNVEIDESSCIRISADGSTNVKGVFAAGDITNASNSLRQVVTAVSEGAISATSAYKYLKEG
ncbi:MAG: FAD-dependent oxidoreductase [Candidatus Paceibacterota bacterium]|jgi:thioredoxin reductase (NADPH)